MSKHPAVPSGPLTADEYARAVADEIEDLVARAPKQNGARYARGCAFCCNSRATRSNRPRPAAGQHLNFAIGRFSTSVVRYFLG